MERDAELQQAGENSSKAPQQPTAPVTCGNRRRGVSGAFRRRNQPSSDWTKKKPYYNIPYVFEIGYTLKKLFVRS